MTTDDLILGGMILAAALLYSTVGHAGASGYLAAMALFGLPPQSMRPTALALNILVATLGTVRFARAGLADFRLLAPFVITSVPAAFVGGALTLPGTAYRTLVGLSLLFAAGHLTLRAARAMRDDAQARHPPWPTAMAVGAIIGVLSGLTGTGGGIFLSPLLLLFRWTDTRHASGVAAAFILVNSIAGLAGTRFSLDALPAALPLWGAAALVGALIGTQLGTRVLPVPGIRYALALVLVVAGAKLTLS